MKKKILSIFITMAAAFALLPVTADAAETETRYLWQGDDNKIYWSTDVPSDLSAAGDGTELVENVLEVSSVIYPMYTLPGGSYQMLEDITLERTLRAFYDITLDLNGYVLALADSAESGSIIDMQEGSLTLKSSNTEREHKFDTSGEVWELAKSDATGDSIRTVTGGVLTGGKGMRPTSSIGVPIGGAVCVLSGNFTMENCNIVGCTAKAGGAVYVKDLSGGSYTFTMTDSRIMGCTAVDGLGDSRGGAIRSGGAVEMSNSVIEACRSVAEGGGIYAGGTVTLKSGSVIESCKGNKGGGVYTDAGLQMESSAVIENCEATISGGGLYLLTGKETGNTMAGKITGCKATETGGGLYYDFENGKTLTISGTIENCTAVNGGGVYLPLGTVTNADKTVILKGGTITGCEATGNGGGVYVDGNKSSTTNTFEMQSGTIKECTAANGGGVYLGRSADTVKQYPKFEMSDGSITGCNATGKGGGVYAGNNGSDSSLNSTVKLEGGSIKGNNAAENGGGIYVETSQLNVRGSVEVTDNVKNGTKNAATGLYNKGESGTDNNIFLPDSYTVNMLQISGGQIGFSLSNLLEGTKVAEGGDTTSFKYCVFDGEADWALYEDNGAKKAGKKTVLLKHGEDSTGYVKFADAYSAAAEGDTLQLLANMEETLSISKKFTLDLNGKNVSGLVVDEPVTIIDSKGGGVIGSLTIDSTEVEISNLLKEGYGFRETENAKWYLYGYETSFSNVWVKKLPIQGRVTISSTEVDAYNSANDRGIYQYGDSETFTASVTLTEGYTSDGADYKWSNSGGNLPDGCTENGNTLSVTFPRAGDYGFSCDVTVDGYTATPAIGGLCTVEKVTLTEDAEVGYTAPTAKSGLVYNGSNLELITAGKLGTGVNTTDATTAPRFYYGLEWEPGDIYWGDTPMVTRALAAGDYKVYWYIDGGANYENVGSKDKPKELTVSIGKANPTAEMFDFTEPGELTYDGAAKTASVIGMNAETGEITVNYFKDGTGTAEAKDAGAYTVKIDVAESGNYLAAGDLTAEEWKFTIAKASQTVQFADWTIVRGSEDVDISGWATAEGIEGGSAPGGLVYELDGSVTGVTLEEGLLTVEKSVVAGTQFSVRVMAAETDNYEASDWKYISVTVRDIPLAEVKTLPVAKTLVYSGRAQALITAGESEGGTLYYSLSTDGTTENETGYSAEVPTAKDAGKYRVYYKVIADKGYQNTTAACVDVEIAKADAKVTAPTAKTLVYSGEAQALIAAGETADGELQYSLSADDGTENAAGYSMTVPTAKDAGTYRVYYRVVGDKNHEDTASDYVDVTIAKAAAAVTAPTARELTYSGEAQALITAGETAGGTLQYSLSADGGAEGYSTTIPTATDAGKYRVYYRVIADKNHTDTTSAYVDVTIAKAAAAVTTVPTAETLVYSGEAQLLVTAGAAAGGILQYSLSADGAPENTAGYSTTVPTAKDAGTYRVYYKAVGDANHADTTAAYVDVTIARAAAAVTTVPTAREELTYSGEAQALVTAGAAAGGELQYSVSAGGETENPAGYSAEVPTATNAGTYRVYYKAVGDANHADTTAAYVDVTIARAAAAVSTAPTARELTYSGEAQALVTAGETTGGELQYSLSTDGTTENETGYSAEVPTATDAGKYRVYYRVAGDKNHTDVAAAHVDITIAKAAAAVSTAPTAATLVYSGEAQALVTAGETADGTLQYSLSADGEAENTDGYSTAIPTATDAGKYRVYYRVIADKNHTDMAAAYVDITIAKAGAAVAAPAARELTYTGEAQELITAGEAADGEMQYSLSTDGEAENTDGYSTAIPTATNAGTYRVYYRAAGDQNHEDTTAYVDVTISPASIAGAALTLGGELTFNGSEQTKEIVAVTVNGKVLTTDDYSVQGNKATAAGSYELTVSGKGNYTGEVKKDWSIAAADGSGSTGGADEGSGSTDGSGSTGGTDDGSGSAGGTDEGSGSAGGTDEGSGSADGSGSTVSGNDGGTDSGSTEGSTDSGSTGSTDSGSTGGTGEAGGSTGALPSPEAAMSGAAVRLAPVADWSSVNTLLQEISDRLQQSSESADSESTEQGGMNINLQMNGNTRIPTGLLRTLAGTELTLAFQQGNGIALSISGSSLNGDNLEDAEPLELTVDVNASAIPTDIIRERQADTFRQLQIRDTGSFTVPVNLHIDMGAENAGSYANFYRYNAAEERLEYCGSFRITQNGQAMTRLIQGGSYLVTVTDTRPVENYVFSGDSYEVQSGDTLGSIARRYHTTVAELLRRNPLLKNPNRIRTGQKLFVN